MDLLGGPVGGPLERALRAAGRRLVGRRFTVPGTGGDLVLRLDALRARPDPLALALGQFGDVGVSATEVEWRGTPVRRLDLLCRNVHVRPGGTVVAAPVTLAATVGADVVRELVAGARPALRLDPGRAGEARASWSRRPGPAALHVAPEIAGSALLLHPTALEVGGRRMRLPAWLPAVRIGLPALPRTLRLHAVEPGGDAVVLRFAADEWTEDLLASPLLDLLT